MTNFTCIAVAPSRNDRVTVSVSAMGVASQEVNKRWRPQLVLLRLLLLLLLHLSAVVMRRA